MNDSNVKFRLNNSELWGGLIGLALGVFVIWPGVKLKLGTINDPGSGYVLFYTGILMCLFAVSIVIAAITEGGPTLRLRAGRMCAGPSRCSSSSASLRFPLRSSRSASCCRRSR